MNAASSFGPFVLDPERGVLLHDGQPVTLGHRAFSVLAVLAESPGRTVPKAELMNRVRPNTFVEEGNLTVQIAALRKALGETSDGQSWILTMPRVGFRLLASSPGLSEPATDLPDRPQLAVLPFRGCCETDANSSHFEQVGWMSVGAELPPLGESGGAG